MSYRWAVLAAGTTAQASFSTISFAIAVLAPALRDKYDLSLTEIGVVLAAEWVGLTFALLPWGYAVDRFGEPQMQLSQQRRQESSLFHAQPGKEIGLQLHVVPVRSLNPLEPLPCEPGGAAPTVVA